MLAKLFPKKVVEEKPKVIQIDPYGLIPLVLDPCGRALKELGLILGCASFPILNDVQIRIQEWRQKKMVLLQECAAREMQLEQLTKYYVRRWSVKDEQVFCE